MTLLSELIRKRQTRKAATAIPAISATQQKEGTGTVARIATVALANTADLKTVIATTSDISSNALAAGPSDLAKEAFDERAAIMEFDGQLDRESAEQCAHAIVFCKDCLHHIPQPDSISRRGNTHATPSGCDLGLITPESWPPIYSFTGWRCPRYSETPNMRASISLNSELCDV